MATKQCQIEHIIIRYAGKIMTCQQLALEIKTKFAVTVGEMTYKLHFHYQ